MFPKIYELYIFRASLILSLLVLTYIIYKSVQIIKRHRDVRINESYSVLSEWIFKCIVIAAIFRFPYDITLLSLHWNDGKMLKNGLQYSNKIPMILC